MTDKFEEAGILCVSKNGKNITIGVLVGGQKVWLSVWGKEKVREVLDGKRDWVPVFQPKGELPRWKKPQAANALEKGLQE